MQPVKAYPSTPAYDWVLILYVKMFMIIISYSPIEIKVRENRRDKQE
jgi:hypothetical protein